MPRISAFYRNVNSINLDIFPTHFEKKSTSILEIEKKPWGVCGNMKGCIIGANLGERGGVGSNSA